MAQVINNEWIPLPDGTRLAARIWLPEGAEHNPVPALLEYLPYRKSDGTAVRDAANHGYFAAHGYAGIRVDIRGAGDSDGVMVEQLGEQEVRDGVAVIDWIAVQPWCNGRVGMFGLSWGGIIGLRIAAAQPSALQAIVATCACEDPKHDVAHYQMGCFPAQAAGWGALSQSYAVRPPDPQVVGERWRDMWFERMEQAPLYLASWLRESRPPAAFAHNIKVPVYAVGGLADTWPGAVADLMQRLQSPRKGLIGPWTHCAPHVGKPGPAIGFLQEVVRWFDHWLKDIDTGIMDEPMLRVYMQESVRPWRNYSHRAGRWIAMPTESLARSFTLNEGRLDGTAGKNVVLQIRSPQGTGSASGDYMPWSACGPTPELPGDQREDDACSLAFDSEELDSRQEILGRPEVELHISSDSPAAVVAVRLCDVAPDGASTLISRGFLNLAEREGKSELTPLEPGRFYSVAVTLQFTAYAVPPGHRLRLAISTAYWPMVWPLPIAATLSLRTGVSRLSLPVARPGDPDEELSAFGQPTAGEVLPSVQLRQPWFERRQHMNVADGREEYCIDEDHGRLRLSDSGLEYGSGGRQCFTINSGDPLSARAAYVWNSEHGRGDWRVRMQSRLTFTATATGFMLNAELDAWEGESRVLSRSWSESIPRGHL